jgi:DNA-binding transcriptional MerR regulator/methylmalonyl-CoA mutase cobalamin-binding subunit
MNIGSISQATGIPTNTLRTWERRYGFPKPARTDSGQRVYRPEVVAHLRLISKALDAGHRPRHIMEMSPEELQALFAPQRQVPVSSVGVPDAWKRATEDLDSEAMVAMLRHEAARIGTLAFIETRVGPFLQWVGAAWAEGTLAIHQEHFASDHVRARLTGMIRSMSLSQAPPVLCASIGQDPHDLGVCMAAVVVATAGLRPVVLGGATPVEELIAATKRLEARHVAISASLWAPAEDVLTDLVVLRAALPESIRIWVGGAGAPDSVNGIRIEPSLRALLTYLQDA